jgi:uncharacterized protein involved in exopolysaccharide biosynthesis
MPGDDSLDLNSVKRPAPELQSIDLLEIIAYVYKKRSLIAACTSAAFLVGLLYSLLLHPIYRAEAVISPNETKSGIGLGGASSIMAQFGQMGGLATQLGFGNPNLNRLEIVAKSRELAQLVIEKNKLLPELYPGLWDHSQNIWKKKAPSEALLLRDANETLRNGMLKVTAEANDNTLVIAVESENPGLCKRIVDGYLDALNDRIHQTIEEESAGNKEYLDGQLLRTLDPALKEKIQNLAAYEIEKAMLVSRESFEILEHPILPWKKVRPRRSLIVLVALLVGFSFSVAGVLAFRYFSDIGNTLRRDYLNARRFL